MQRMMCVLQSFGISLSAQAAAEAGPGMPPGLHLSWVRAAEAASCVDAAQVEIDVKRRLGWSPFEVSTGPNASVETLVTRSDGVWKASIMLRRADGTSLGAREVESDAATCDSLARASGLAIVLMLESAYSDLAGSAPKAHPPTAHPGVPVASDHSLADAGSAPVAAATSESDTRPPGVGLTGGVLCAAGILPRWACGATLGSELTLGDHFAATIAVGFLPEQSVVASDSNVAFGLTFVAGGACYQLELNGAWALSTCASLLVGALHVTVTVPTPVAPGERVWWAASTGLRLGWRTGAFKLQGGLDAVAPISPRDYVVERVEPTRRVSLFEEAPVGAMAVLGAGVLF